MAGAIGEPEKLDKLADTEVLKYGISSHTQLTVTCQLGTAVRGGWRADHQERRAKNLHENKTIWKSAWQPVRGKTSATMSNPLFGNRWGLKHPTLALCLKRVALECLKLERSTS